MRTYLAVAPVWVVAVVDGVFFAVIWTAWTALLDHGLGWHLLVIGAGVGAVSGVGASFAVRRERRRTDHIVGALSAVQRRAVVRAVATGRPPEDPALRLPAVAMARDSLAEDARTKTVAVGFVAVLAVVSALFGFDSWWYLGVAAGFVAMIVAMLRSPAGLRKRIATLELADAQGEDRRLATQ